MRDATASGVVSLYPNSDVVVPLQKANQTYINVKFTVTVLRVHNGDFCWIDALFIIIHASNKQIMKG